MCCFEVSIKPNPVEGRLGPFNGTQTRSSSTRTATADVNKGNKAVTPNTNLRDPNWRIYSQVLVLT